VELCRSATDRHSPFPSLLLFVALRQCCAVALAMLVTTYRLAARALDLLPLADFDSNTDSIRAM